MPPLRHAADGAATQAVIQFIGSLSSWWARIVIGVLTFIFIGVQTILSNRKKGYKGGEATPALLASRRKRQRLAVGFTGLAVLALAVTFSYARFSPASPQATVETSRCEVNPFREAEAESLIQAGAVIVYNRTAGPECVDELFAIYPDGRITGRNDASEVSKQVPPEEVGNLLTAISVEHNGSRMPSIAHI